MRRELNHLNLIHFCLKNEVVCFIARSTINKEDMLRLAGSAIVVLNKMVQLNHTDSLICVFRRGDSNNLMPSYIFMKLKDHNYYSKYNNYK